MSSSLSRISPYIRNHVFLLLGINQASDVQAGRSSRVGLFVNGTFLVAVGLVAVLVSSLFVVLSIPLFVFGAYDILVSRRRSLTLSRSNLLSLGGHVCAAIFLYVLLTRVLWVTYMTDSIVGSYMGILKALAFQNPYGYSIKPFLDQFSFPPSFYTPRIDGSFEFHLNYPALNFLALLPLYAAGLHDLRDGVFLFHLVSVLLIFGLVPSRQKALGLAPFVFFPAFVAASWTDSVWAFFLVGGAILWYKNRNLALAMIGFAGATKQIALIVLPFLLIRLWQESPGSRIKNTLTGATVAVVGFLGPNLPFIISSPSSWWVATILPYLPGGAAQVPGGVGLSGLLLLIGVAPPPLFFVLLVGIATGTSLYLYTFRLARSSYFVWVFPILIMFFYYRSFPNYLFYWTIPLVFEFFRVRPSLSIWRFSPIHLFSWHPSMGSALLSLRSKFRVPLIAGMLLTTVFVGAFGAYASNSSTSGVQVEINSVADPDGIGATTLLNVTLENLTSQPIVPSFFVKWYVLPYLWASNSNQTVYASSAATFLVTATDGLAAVPRGMSFRVYVYDSRTGSLVGESSGLRADATYFPIENSHFRWWTLDVGSGEKVPFGWKLTKINVASSTSVIEPLGQSQDGVSFYVNYTSPGVKFERVTLSQRVVLNATKIRLSVLNPFPISTSTGVILGLFITDGAHELSYIFSNETGLSISSSSYNYTKVIPVSSSTWTSILIDSNQDWQAQGWAIPSQVTFSVFLQADNLGDYTTSITGITHQL